MYEVGEMIVTLGEVIVDFLVEEPGEGFCETLHIRGPFPAGAPAIFADQAALLGVPCGLISCVGQDDFGTLTLRRLEADGVDISAVAIEPEQVTGSAFVRYHADGERDFLFNIVTSASGRTRLTSEATALLERANHVHIMGSSLFSAPLVEAALRAVDLVKARGGSVSFDPNARKEMLNAPHMRVALDAMLDRCDIFLPSGAELFLFTKSTDEAEAAAELLRRGVREIVVKGGRNGARYYGRDNTHSVAAHAVEEADATGAGDCFGAIYVSCRSIGYSPEESLRFANAGGALAVTRQGAMAGSTFHDLHAFLESRAVSER